MLPWQSHPCAIWPLWGRGSLGEHRTPRLCGQKWDSPGTTCGTSSTPMLCGQKWESPEKTSCGMSSTPNLGLMGTRRNAVGLPTEVNRAKADSKYVAPCCGKRVMMLVLRRGRTLTVHGGSRPLPPPSVDEQGVAPNIRASCSIPNPSDPNGMYPSDDEAVHHS